MRTIGRFLALTMFLALCGGCRKPVVGCTDANYDNYDPMANEDDGCCCNIVKREIDDEPNPTSFNAYFDSIPEGVSDMLMINLTSYVQRVDQTAEGPCGCLVGYQSGLYAGFYSPEDVTYYGPRTICSTSIGWWCRPSDNVMDTTEWNLIAAANVFDPDANSLCVTYTVHFPSMNSEDLHLQFTDTLPGVIEYFTNSPMVRVDWGRYYNYTQHIYGEDLPCEEYPDDSSSVTIDSLRIL